MPKKKMTLKEFAERYECCYSAASVRLKKLIAKDKKFAKHVSRQFLSEKGNFSGLPGGESVVRRGMGADTRKHRICVPKFKRLSPPIARLGI